MNALPILLLGGAAALYMTRKKPVKAIADDENGDMSKGTAQGPGGPIEWRVIATGQGTYVAQWKRIKETSWRDAATFSSKEEAASSIAGAIVAGNIP